LYNEGTHKLKDQTKKYLIEKYKSQPIKPINALPIGFDMEKAQFKHDLQGIEEYVVNKNYRKNNLNIINKK